MTNFSFLLYTLFYFPIIFLKYFTISQELKVKSVDTIKLFITGSLLPSLIAMLQIYKVTKHTQQKIKSTRRSDLWATSSVKKKSQEQEKKTKNCSSLLASDVTPALYSPQFMRYHGG